MNVVAFVAAMNIPQIVECSLSESATFDILFCLFRNRSSTLFAKSGASLPMTNILESASDRS